MNFCVDSLLWTKHGSRDERIVKTMDFTNELVPKKAKIVKSAGKVMTTVFGMSTRYNLYRLPFVEANGQWRLLHSFIGLFQHFKEKMSLFSEEESVLSLKQCTGSRARHRSNSTNSAMNCFPIQHIRQI